ncbi:hypothetical protein JCGZ_20300 [Jatropha curcas]|uniref:Pectinesterase inhibitor domain-containing protein n=1 Tax=Jatropha curcas TaxID=180498 RepID=A0A067JTV4_JATCU|nr:hypothetical protein JCGZ_20300 [Jatropha curcas]
MSSKFFYFALFLAMISTSHQASEFVTQSCEKTLFKDLCTTALESSSATDLEGLTKDALNVLSTNGTELVKLSSELQETASDPNVKEVLVECSKAYEGVTEKLKDSAAALDSKAYGDLTKWVTAAMTGSQKCSEAFKAKPDITSPLADANTEYSKLCNIVFAFFNLLAKS